MSSGMESIPLFSPSQMSENEEKVLHSIFSPSFGKSTAARLEELTGMTKYDDCSHFEIDENPPFASGEGEIVEEERELVKVSDMSLSEEDRICRSHRTSLDRITEEDPSHLSPNPTSSQSKREIPKSVNFRLGSDTTEVDNFYTPQSALRGSAMSMTPQPLDMAVSPISAVDDASSFKSAHMNTSWNDVPLEMLNFEFVSSCESISELESVVSALEYGDGPAQYPSLLRLSKARLNILRKDSKTVKIGVTNNHQTTEKILTFCSQVNDGVSSFEGRFKKETFVSKMEGTFDAPRPSIITSKESNPWRNTVHNGLSVRDSLKIPSTNLEPGEESMRAVELALCEDIPFNDSEGLSKVKRNGVLQRDEPSYDDLKVNLNSMIAAHYSLSAKLNTVIGDRNDIKKKLDAETKRCQDLEDKISSQIKRVIALEKAKFEVEADVAILEETVVSSSSKAQEISSELKLRAEKVHSLEKELQKEREYEKKKVANVKLLQDRIEKLSNQLVFQEEKARKALHNLEVELRQDYKRISVEHRAKIAELTMHLSESRDCVNKLKQSNEDLYQCTHELKKQAHNNEGKDRLQKKYKKVAAQANSAELAAKVMASALALSESELSQAIEAKSEYEKKLSSLLEENSYLKTTNTNLSERIKDINGELDSGHTYTDKLMGEIESLRQKQGKCVETKEMNEKLLRQIAQLQSCIKGQQSLVSVDRYQEVLKKVKTQADVIIGKERELKQLSARNQELEILTKKEGKEFNLLKKFSSVSIAPESRTGRGDAVSSHRVTPLADIITKKIRPMMEKEQPKEAIPQYISPLSEKITGKSLARRSAVRAAGGRAGLTAKLKKSRGSALRSTQRKQIELICDEEQLVAKSGHVGKHQSLAIKSSKTVSWSENSKENQRLYFR